MYVHNHPRGWKYKREGRGILHHDQKHIRPINCLNESCSRIDAFSDKKALRKHTKRMQPSRIDLFV